MWALLRIQVVVLVVQNLGNVFAYVFQILLARSMEPGAFGCFNALFSFSLILAAPCIAIQQVYSRRTVMLDAGGDNRGLGRLLWHGIASGLGLTLVFLALAVAAAEPIRTFLLADLGDVYLVAVLSGLTFAHAIIMGLLQGQRRYLPLSLGISTVPFGRMVLGLTLVTTWRFGVTGALWSCLIGVVMGIAVALWPLRGLLWPVAKRFGHQPDLWQRSWVLVANCTLIMILGNADQLLIRHYFTPEESGVYGMLALIARIAFLLPVALTHVLFPEAMIKRQRGGGRLLWMFMGSTALLSGAVVVAAAVFPGLLLGVLGWIPRPGDAELLLTLCFAMTMLALCNTLATYLMAAGGWSFLVPLATAAVGFVVAASVLHDTPLIVARLLLMLIGAAVMAMLALTPLAKKTVPVT